MKLYHGTTFSRGTKILKEKLIRGNKLKDIIMKTHHVQLLMVIDNLYNKID